ncbi:hypothetical protein [Atrimonas thermophila]|uniref:hypothetical protein n=1 Tax=Atrimonas thermophila TaxID=3064161 RepID=UPI00399D24E5
MGRKLKEENWIAEEIMELQAKLLDRRSPAAVYVMKKTPQRATGDQQKVSEKSAGIENPAAV